MIAAASAEVDRAEFRFVRPLVVAQSGPTVVEPDGPLFAHAKPGFADLRFLDATGREVPWRIAPPALGPDRVVRPLRSLSRVERPARTVIRLDLGFRGIAVDELQIRSGTQRYKRAISVLGSDDGHRYAFLARARIHRFRPPHSPPLRVSGKFRYLKLRIWNGDDPPLREVRVEASSDGDPLLAEGGHPRPYTVLYGAPGVQAPHYDYARLPLGSRLPERAVRGRLGRERPNPAFLATPKAVDERSLFTRHQGLVTVALVVAALATAIAGAVALRGPRDSI